MVVDVLVLGGQLFHDEFGHRPDVHGEFAAYLLEWQALKSASRSGFCSSSIRLLSGQDGCRLRSRGNGLRRRHGDRERRCQPGISRLQRLKEIFRRSKTMFGVFLSARITAADSPAGTSGAISCGGVGTWFM